MPFHCPACGMTSPDDHCEAPWCGGQTVESTQFRCSVCETYSTGSVCANPACTPAAKALTYFCDGAYKFIDRTDVFAICLAKDNQGKVWLVWSLNTSQYDPNPGLLLQIMNELDKPQKPLDSTRLKYAKGRWALLTGVSGYKAQILKCIMTGYTALVPQYMGESYYHAEMRVLNYVLAQGLTTIDPSGLILIGISKKPCILCSSAIGLAPFVLVRSPHLIIYKKWYIAPFLLTDTPLKSKPKPELALLQHLQSKVSHYQLKLNGKHIDKGAQKQRFPDQDQFNDSDDESYL